MPFQSQEFVALRLMRETTSSARTSENNKIAELDLAAEILASGGIIRLRAFGSSMLPAIWPGDILTIESVALRWPVTGDIVLIRINNRAFIHRVQELQSGQDSPRWITRGDAVPECDPAVSGAQLQGTVSLIQRGRRWIVPSPQRSNLVRLLAWVLCHCNPLRNICLRAHQATSNSRDE